MVTQYAWPANSDFIMAIVHGIKYLFVQYTNREIHFHPPPHPVCVCRNSNIEHDKSKTPRKIIWRTETIEMTIYMGFNMLWIASNR